MIENDEFGVSSATMADVQKQKRDDQFGASRTLCATVIENCRVRFEKFGIQLFMNSWSRIIIKKFEEFTFSNFLTITRDPRILEFMKICIFETSKLTPVDSLVLNHNVLQWCLPPLASGIAVNMDKFFHNPNYVYSQARFTEKFE